MTDQLRYELSKALTAAGIILYIPANFLPVMTITITGQVESLTVMGGVMELYDTGLVPVAAHSPPLPIVTTASHILSLVFMVRLHPT